MIIQETHLVEYKGRIIPLYKGETWDYCTKYYAQWGNPSEYDDHQIVQFEEVDIQTAMELIKNSSI